LATELPTGVNETDQGVIVVKDENNAELLHAESESRLQLDHLHERFFPGLVIDSDTFAFPRTRHQDLYSRIAEDSVAGGLLNRSLRRRLGFVKPLQDLLGVRPDFILFLRYFLRFVVVRVRQECTSTYERDDDDFGFRRSCESADFHE
jgi:hypothetical protein